MINKYLTIDKIIYLVVIISGVTYLITRNYYIVTLVSIILSLLLFSFRIFRSKKQIIRTINKEILIVNPKNISIFSEFICNLSGVDVRILTQHFPYEITKYFTLGLSILLTGILATLSGGYAIYQTFGSLYWAIFIGLLWGILIVNIDRIMILTIVKERSTLKQILSASPRFVLAIFISIVISKPIEVKFFESRLEVAIGEEKIEKDSINVIKIINGSNIRKYENDVDKKNTEIQKIENKELNIENLYRIKENKVKDINRLNTEIRIYKLQLESINNQTIILDGVRQLTSVAQEKYDKINSEIERLEKKLKLEQKEFSKHISNIENKIKSFNEQKEKELDILRQSKIRVKVTLQDAEQKAIKEIADIKTRSEKTYGESTFIVQVETLEKLKQKESIIWWISNLLMILFITIETMPILSKLMSRKGSYDHYLSMMIKQTMIKTDKKIDEF